MHTNAHMHTLMHITYTYAHYVHMCILRTHMHATYTYAHYILHTTHIHTTYTYIAYVHT
jgi:hypothetical protein